MDDTGKHIIISSDKGDNYHVSYNEQRLKELTVLQGKIIRFVLWEDSPAERTFNNSLIVTQENKFYIYSLNWNEEKG